MKSEILCKYCSSANIVKYGKFEGIQRYWCKDCKRKFADNKALPYMRTPKEQVACALSCYFGGMPLDAIQRHLNQQYGTYYSKSGIYYWIIRFAEDAVRRAKAFKPIVGDTWAADETVLRVGNRNIWFWDIIDEKSKFLLASHLSTSRTTKDACRLMREAYLKAGKAPKRIITDQLQAYLDGIELVFGADTKHIQSKPFIDTDSTNVIRGFGNMDTAKLLTDAWLVHYNFFKEHESLGNIPPAQKMGIPTPFKDWEDVVREYKTTFIQTYEPTEIVRLTYYTRLTQPRKAKAKQPRHRAIPIPKLTMIKRIRHK